MRRRDFLKSLARGLVLLPALRMPLACGNGRSLRFGVVTDVHFARREMAINRYYTEALDKLRAAVEQFNAARLDFVIELGDLKDMGPAGDPAESLRFLDEIESALQGFRGPVWHVLGNHDCDCISKAEFWAHTDGKEKELLRHTRHDGIEGAGCYSFRARGFRCIVLDADFNADGTDYDRGNFHWTSAWLPDWELEWLERELDSAAGEPTLIFVHQMLDHFSTVSPQLVVRNAPDAVALLERHPQVLAVFQGHHHPGFYSSRAGIHYVTFPGMIEGPWPAHTAYAIVEIQPGGSIRIEGSGDCPDREFPGKA